MTVLGGRRLGGGKEEEGLLSTGAGLLLMGCYPTDDNTVTLVINNPTASAVDRPAESWAFWVIR